MSNKHPINVETKPKPNESIERTLKAVLRRLKQKEQTS